MTFATSTANIPRSCRRTQTQIRLVSTLPRPYRFHIGASWAGKPPEPQPRRVKTKPFHADSEIGTWRDQLLSRYHSAVGSHVGEDFFYVQDMRNQSGVSFGVADGVGGWIDSGVDPSLFSQALMYHAHRYATTAWAGEPEIDPTQDYEEREKVDGWEITPVECLELAYGGVLRERLVQAAALAWITRLKHSLSAHYERVIRSLARSEAGDSGFSIIRSSAVIHQQRVQQHFFNCPKQLSKLPTSVPRFSRACIDSPRDAETFETKLRDGDIVIAYTDGLSDNVFPSEIIQICSLVGRQFNVANPPIQSRQSGNEGANPDQLTPENSEDQLAQTMAERIVDYARLCMGKKTRVSPFERAAAREGMYFRGGKVDDVTVVVALVKETI